MLGEREMLGEEKREEPRKGRMVQGQGPGRARGKEEAEKGGEGGQR